MRGVAWPARHVPSVSSEMSFNSYGNARGFVGESSHANVVIEPQSREDFWWVWWKFLFVEASSTGLEKVERDRRCSLEHELAEELALAHVEGEEHDENVSGGVGKRSIFTVDSIACKEREGDQTGSI